MGIPTPKKNARMQAKGMTCQMHVGSFRRVPPWSAGMVPTNVGVPSPGLACFSAKPASATATPYPVTWPLLCIASLRCLLFAGGPSRWAQYSGGSQLPHVLAPKRAHANVGRCLRLMLLAFLQCIVLGPPQPGRVATIGHQRNKHANAPWISFRKLQSQVIGDLITPTLRILEGAFSMRNYRSPYQ